MELYIARQLEANYYYLLIIEQIVLMLAVIGVTATILLLLVLHNFTPDIHFKSYYTHE